eukprot:459567-Amphidinium_carterae.1
MLKRVAFDDAFKPVKNYFNPPNQPQQNAWRSNYLNDRQNHTLRTALQISSFLLLFLLYCFGVFWGWGLFCLEIKGAMHRVNQAYQNLMYQSCESNIMQDVWLSCVRVAGSSDSH